MMKTVALITAFLLMLSVPCLAASSLRCGNKVISVGDTKAQVLAKCGEPLLVEAGTVEKRSRQRTGTASAEQWTYNFGPSKFMKILTFRGSKLMRIEDGDRGFNP